MYVVVVNDDMLYCSACSCSSCDALQSSEQTKRTSYGVGRHQSDVLPREHNNRSNEVAHNAASPGISGHSSILPGQR